MFPLRAAGSFPSRSPQPRFPVGGALDRRCLLPGHHRTETARDAARTARACDEPQRGHDRLDRLRDHAVHRGERGPAAFRRLHPGADAADVPVGSLSIPREQIEELYREAVENSPQPLRAIEVREGRGPDGEDVIQEVQRQAVPGGRALADCRHAARRDRARTGYRPAPEARHGHRTRQRRHRPHRPRDGESFIDVNHSYCALLGYSREELVGHPAAEIAFRNAAQTAGRLRQGGRGGAGNLSEETRFRQKGGRVGTGGGAPPGHPLRRALDHRRQRQGHHRAQGRTGPHGAVRDGAGPERGRRLPHGPRDDVVP